MVAAGEIRQVLESLDSEAVVELTARLVKINSVWDPEAGTSEREAAALVAAWAKGEGFEVAVEEAAPGRPNVIITLGGLEGPGKLMFEAHTDVVTPGDPAAWRHDPFGARIIGRRMYGRGTNDTKGNLAAMLVALKALKDSRAAFKGDVVAGVLCDEEDMMTGVRDFIARGRADDVTGAIICEPQDGLICCTQKGALRARYAVTGRMSHGAMPLSGLNPAPALAGLIQGLARLEQQEMARHGQDDLLGWPSLTPTAIRSPAKGPPQLNVIPAQAELLVDVRSIPAQSHPHLRAAMRALAAETAAAVNEAYADLDRRLKHRRPLDLKVEVEFLTDRPATLTDRSDPLARAVHWAVETMTGQAPVYAGVPGATDGTFLWSLKNIPIVTIGAGDREVPHQVDEWVDLDQLILTARIYALSALAYLR